MSAIALNIKEGITALFQASNFSDALSQRKVSMALLEEKGLPDTRNEEYRFTPIAKAIEKNFSWSTQNPSPAIESIAEYLIQDLDCNLLVFINGIYAEQFSKIISPSSQVEVSKLTKALDGSKAEVNQYFDQLLKPNTDSFAALNSALWQDGLFIRVPENTTVDKPFFILHLNDASKDQVMAHTRLFMSVEKNSEVSIIEKFDSVGSSAVLHTFNEEIIVAAEARLEYCKIQNDQGHSFQVTNTCIHQSNSSKVNTFTLTMDGQMIRNNLTIVIDGENCESHFHGLYLLNGKTHADNHTVVDHKKPNSFSNEIYKGILDDQSKGIFNGKIFVRPHAQKTNAFQSNRNILISDSAIINTKPQLEIWADDVKCSHGCTSGQLDEEALFYLRSRGISESNAKAMLLYAFAADVLEPIKNEVVKKYMDELIAHRLHQ